jgi:amino acid transporter
VSLPWELYAAIGVALSGFLSYRRIDLSAKVLGTLMLCEIGVLLVLDCAVLGSRGTAALPVTSFAPGTVFSTGLGVSLLLAFSSFIGFESAALHGEESRNPKRTVPLATYWSLAVITLFYGVTSWIGVGAVGAGKVQSVAGRQLGNYFLAINDQYVGSAMTTVMSVLICTSLFASLLAIQNAGSRYIYALGREGVLPGWLGQEHPRYRSPARATLIITALNVVVPAIYALNGLNPYLNLSTSMGGLGAIGIITLQGLASASVVGYFWRHPGRHWWRTVLAPAIGVGGLVYAAVLVVRNFPLLTGTSSTIVNGLPWLVVAAAVSGLCYARWLRKNRSAVYRDLASDVHVSRGSGQAAVDPLIQPTIGTEIG